MYTNFSSLINGAGSIWQCYTWRLIYVAHNSASKELIYCAPCVLIWLHYLMLLFHICWDSWGRSLNCHIFDSHLSSWQDMFCSRWWSLPWHSFDQWREHITVCDMQCLNCLQMGLFLWQGDTVAFISSYVLSIFMTVRW